MEDEYIIIQNPANENPSTNNEGYALKVGLSALGLERMTRAMGAGGGGRGGPKGCPLAHSPGCKPWGDRSRGE